VTHRTCLKTVLKQKILKLCLFNTFEAEVQVTCAWSGYCRCERHFVHY